MSSTTDDTLSASITSIGSGASTFIIGTGISKLVGFLFNLLLTNYLGVVAYGAYTFAFTFVSILSDFGTFGAEQGNMRFFSEELTDGDSESFVVTLGYVTTLLGSTILSGVLFLTAGFVAEVTNESQSFVEILRLFSLSIPLYAVANFTVSIFRALEDLQYQVLVRDLVSPLVKLALTGVAAYFGVSVLGIVVAVASVSVFNVFVSTALLLWSFDVRPTIRGGVERVREYYGFTLPLAAKDIGGIVMSRVDIFMIAFFLSSAEVGLYNVAVLISSILVLPVRAMNQVFPPVLSRLYHSGQDKHAQRVFRVISRWGFSFTLLPAAWVALFRSELLSVFGGAYTASSTALALLSIGYILKATTGPTGYVLTMSDNQNINLVNQVVMATVNISLNYIFIPIFGITGAALSTAITRGVTSLLITVETWVIEGMVPHDSKTLKPLAAGVAASGVLLAVAWAFDGIGSALGGGVVGCLVFLVFAYRLGLTNEDYMMIESLTTVSDWF